LLISVKQLISTSIRRLNLPSKKHNTDEAWLLIAWGSYHQAVLLQMSIPNCVANQSTKF